MSRNPFGVLSPEQLDASYIADYFVDVFTDLPRLRDKGNTFISGARGTGKSMLLRSLEPQVLLITKKCESLNDLPYLSVHVPLRKAEFGVTELNRLSGFASVAIGEHLLVMQVIYRLTELLVAIGESIPLSDAKAFSARFVELFTMSGGTVDTGIAEKAGGAVSLFSSLNNICENEIISVRQYYTRLPFYKEIQDYKGALVGFLDFLVPLATVISNFSIFRQIIPLFVMLDDADNLPKHMQRVINSWVSTRSTHVLCLKITTQLGYATFRTVDNRLIESPHDFSEVNLSAIYTSEHNTYAKRVEEIIRRRLDLAGISRNVLEFFPRDEEQANRLEQIEAEIEADFQERAKEGATRRGSSRLRDETQRYAVPRLMRELAGTSRSSHTYSYSGFKSLVDLSSGVVRWFLEPASRMYDRVVSEQGAKVEFIPVAIQDKVMVEWANEFVQKLSAVKIDPPSDSLAGEDDDASLHAIGHETELYERLKNLLDGLGLLFRQRLLDENASEQRVFSVVLRDKPGPQLSEVLDLGLRLGYLQKSDNASKEAIGVRRTRYILARRLGPHYRLDVSGYAAHLSVTSLDLELATRSPQEFVRKRHRVADTEDEQFSLQLGLPNA